MPETFSALLAAYLIGSFAFQTSWVTGQKSRLYDWIFPAGVITLVSYLLLGVFAWKLLALILVAHIGLRVASSSNSLARFLLNQIAGVFISILLAFYFSPVANCGWWKTQVSPELSRWYFASLNCASGAILCVLTGGVLIAKLITPLADEIREVDIAGLRQGGQYIGWLERILVMLLILADQPNGIGFLIAAKSILRFGEIKDASQRKVTEYIIIGTFLSFGWALMFSVLTQKAIRYWIH